MGHFILNMLSKANLVFVHANLYQVVEYSRQEVARGFVFDEFCLDGFSSG